jgi:hypothetical protein
MVALTEEGGIQVRNGHPHTRAIELRTIIVRQGPFPHLPFSSQQILNFLTELPIFVTDCKVYLLGTVKRFGKKCNG